MTSPLGELSGSCQVSKSLLMGRPHSWPESHQAVLTLTPPGSPPGPPRFWSSLSAEHSILQIRAMAHGTVLVCSQSPPQQRQLLQDRGQTPVQVHISLFSDTFPVPA